MKVVVNVDHRVLDGHRVGAGFELDCAADNFVVADAGRLGVAQCNATDPPAALEFDGPDSVHSGRILPTLSATQYAATLLDWIGLQEHQIDQVLPNLRNFGTRNLGFLA